MCCEKAAFAPDESMNEDTLTQRSRLAQTFPTLLLTAFIDNIAGDRYDDKLDMSFVLCKRYVMLAGAIPSFIVLSLYMGSARPLHAASALRAR